MSWPTVRGLPPTVTENPADDDDDDPEVASPFPVVRFGFAGTVIELSTMNGPTIDCGGQTGIKQNAK